MFKTSSGLSNSLQLVSLDLMRSKKIVCSSMVKNVHSDVHEERSR
jgi:hypothetical protein